MTMRWCWCWAGKIETLALHRKCIKILIRGRQAQSSEGKAGPVQPAYRNVMLALPEPMT